MTRSLFKFNPLDPPLALFVFSAVAGVYPAYDRSSSWPVLAALIVGALLCVLISRVGVSLRWWRAVAAGIVAGALAVLIVLRGSFRQITY